MKTKPLLYSPDMVRAWFAGKKTMTRRPLRTQPRFEPDLLRVSKTKFGEKRLAAVWDDGFEFCPYSVGMEIYGRETWMPFDVTGFSDCNPGVYIGYKATNDIRPDGVDAVSFGASVHYPCSETEWEKFKRQIDLMEVYGDKWHPSIHLPEKFSRIHQTITNIRVERVCDISEEDAIAEGIDGKLCSEYILKSPCADELKPVSVHAYAGLWQSLYGDKYPWETTWVWVLEYPRYEGAK